MKTTVFSLLCASAIISAEVCVDICSSFSISTYKSKVRTFDQLKNTCSRFVESSNTYEDVKTICDKIREELGSGSADSGSNTLSSGGSGNTVNSGGSGNTVNEENQAVSISSSSQVVVASMMTTLTILGLNFL